MRITPRVREEAALLCAVAASTDVYTMAAADHLDTSTDALQLAYAAWSLSFWNTDHRRGEAWCEDWAEAEALLRTGWTPTEPKP